MASLVDTMLGMFRKDAKDPDAPKPAPGSRSEREAKIKDKAGLVINVFALLLALNAWYGGKLSSTVMNNTISANNAWAHYQAKNSRGVSYEIASLQVASADLKAKFIAEKERMDADKKEIAERAKALEAERDAAKIKSPWIGYASTAYQLAIVLLSASILAVSMPLFWGSFVVAAIGIALSAQGVLL